MSRYFDISRFWLLLKLEVFRSRKGILMTFVIVFGMLFFIGLLLDIAVDSHKRLYEHTENYIFSLLAGGFVLSSLAFNDLGNSLKRYHYLTLPASTLEKFVCMWLLTSVGWMGLFTLTYFIYALIANPIGELLFAGVAFEPFNPLDDFAVNTMKYYFILHGIFLVGATHFKGYVLPKTLFVLVLFGAAIGTLAYFILKGVFLSDHECLGYECELLDEIVAHRFWMIIKWVFLWVLAPFCWVTAYIGLKEQEA
ncbi:hypothetical protein C900_02010 [Fulvivirga imtechensis AK7]|uniref:Uncharacterized protein n=1 Tax=Fulvivirga imtechensis AK7 TaxID=1237149 RepID=L8JT44_9BACT|nr:hypothetical protein [Fulvivirga imtechensis]ELR72015.1 hypothetical protein C900_02010 [Fulvivirga imtechensis AK7]